MSRKKSSLQNPRLILPLALLAVAVLSAAYVYLRNTPPRIDPTSYRPLLDLIAQAESKSNYNAYFGNAGNTDIKFTDMTIAEVQAWQADYIQRGAASSAVGRYQIIDSTLQNLVQTLGLNPHSKFDQNTQDQLAVALLEQRGIYAYATGKITRDQFATELAKEWAALPRVIGKNPTHSYYADDGLNTSLVTIDEVRSSIEQIHVK